MDHYQAVNHILVSLFNDIMDVEEREIISDEFKDISSNDMHIIEVIGQEEPKNMSAIASKMKVTVGTLTIAINNLVKKGYVVRTPHQHNTFAGEQTCEKKLEAECQES